MENKSRAHLLRISCLGKLFSDHLLPISLATLCKNNSSQSRQPYLENYGDVSFIFFI